MPLRAAHSLTKLWGAVKADIDRVTQPMLLFRSRQDHVVEPSNAAWIMRHVPSTDKAEVVLERSYHVATMDHDADVIVDGSIAFVQRLAG
ncbi:MAG: alpha/beta hydrolase [Actinomycetales bacterium]